MYAICVLARRVSLRPNPQWAALEGCTAVALIAEYDDARQANRHCARACGALTRVRRAFLWRAQRAVPTSTDPMGILKSTREFKATGAGKEHTSAVRGGGRDPGVRRPGSGLGRPTARSKFFRAAMGVRNLSRYPPPWPSSLALVTSRLVRKMCGPSIFKLHRAGCKERQG